MALSVAACVSQTFEADSDEYWSIKYRQLESVFRNTSLKLNLNGNQTIQGLNSTSNDQSLQVAGATLGTASAIAGAFFTGRVPTPAGIKQNPSDWTLFYDTNTQILNPSVATVCSPRATRALANVQKLKSDLAKGTSSKNSKATDQGSSAASAAQTADSATSSVAGQLAEALKLVSLTIPVTITPRKGDVPSQQPSADGRPTVFKAYPVGFLAQVWQAWGSSSSPPSGFHFSINGSDDTIPVPTNGLSWEHADAVVELSLLDGTHRWKDQSFIDDKPKDSPVAGLVVRQPIAGRLRVCLSLCAPLDENWYAPVDPANAKGDIMAPVTVSIPQFGRHLVLPVDNRFAQNLNISLTVGADGAPSVLSYQSDSSLAAGVSAVGTGASAYTNAINARNTAIAAQNSAATSVATYPDTALKAQADCMQQQAAIVKLGGTPSVPCQ
ncbi:hypothetical protein [Burkholderia sp. 8Y]|uniref:hypothetical protein n=1 Tax=Burkholderia sp. 8Y TaxID=2653133 RepID=UPI001F334F60|nr:hypothetical protein [Burkholderia sp. 8Y]